LKTAAEQVEVTGDEPTALVIARTLLTRAAEVAGKATATRSSCALRRAVTQLRF
jgi:hypothetical protein